MDGSAFDRAARLMGMSVSRRAGLAAAMAALGSSIADAGAKSGVPGKDQRGRPKPAGPCGDGRRKDNICRKDTECCTGICNLKTGNRNKDGAGRCRCLRKGRACKEDRNCCAGAACENGTCGGAPVPPPVPDPVATGLPCVAGVDTCVDSAASCTVYIGGDPAGTYCLLPAAATCVASDDCDSRACSCERCLATCTPNVCASGCDYTDIESAWTGLPAGSEILIAPGTYTVGIEVDKSMTLRGCGDGVVLQARSGATAMFNDVTSSPETLTLERLTLEGVDASADIILKLYGKLSVDLSYCSLENAYGALWGSGADHSATVTCSTVAMGSNASYGIYTSRMDVSIVNSTVSDSYGPLFDRGDITVEGSTFTRLSRYSFYYNDYASAYRGKVSISTSTFTDSTGNSIYLNGCTGVLDTVTVSGIDANGAGASGIYLGEGTYTLTDVTISGNTTTSAGGGLMVVGSARDTWVNLRSGVSITGNTASTGSGIVVVESSGQRVALLGAPGAVSGNTGGDQCVIGPSTFGPWTAVTDCIY